MSYRLISSSSMMSGLESIQCPVVAFEGGGYGSTSSRASMPRKGKKPHLSVKPPTKVGKFLGDRVRSIVANSPRRLVFKKLNAEFYLASWFNKGVHHTAVSRLPRRVLSLISYCMNAPKSMPVEPTHARTSEHAAEKRTQSCSHQAIRLLKTQ